MDEEIETTSLLNTKLEDMTVGDYAKLNGYVLALSVGVGFVTYGAAVAYANFSDWKYNRKMKKTSSNNLTIVE